MEAQTATHQTYREQLRKETLARRARMGMRTPPVPIVVLKPLPAPPSFNDGAGWRKTPEHKANLSAAESRRVEGIVASTKLKRCPTPQELVQDLLVGKVNIHKIIMLVARAHGVTADEICLHTRQLHLTDAKSHIVWVLDRESGYSATALGRLLDLEHTSIIRHRERFRKHYEGFKERVKAVDAALDLLRHRTAPIGSNQLDLELETA